MASYSLTSKSEPLPVEGKPLRVPEAAQLLGLHIETLRGHLEAGKIKGNKIGQWLIPASEIARIRGEELK